MKTRKKTCEMVAWDMAWCAALPPLCGFDLAPPSWPGSMEGDVERQMQKCKNVAIGPLVVGFWILASSAQQHGLLQP